MKRAVRKLLSVRPNSMFVNVRAYDTNYAEMGKCRQNSYNTVVNDPSRYEFVTGWVVHKTEHDFTVVHGHWWNYDTVTQQHIDSSQKFFNTEVSYVVDMDIGKILTKFETSMSNTLDKLFDYHSQVIGNLLFYKDEWYAWDDESHSVFHNFGKTIDLQKLFAMDTMFTIKKTMKPEAYDAFLTYAAEKLK